jgi:hypothetical protein
MKETTMFIELILDFLPWPIEGGRSRRHDRREDRLRLDLPSHELIELLGA